MIVPAAKLFGGIAALGTAATAVAQAQGMANVAIISGGLSLGAIVSAVGAFYVMREKTRRNEQDIATVAGEVRETLTGFRAEMRESLREYREDLRAHRAETRETIQQLVDTINSRAGARRAGDAP